jgi:hypothetical protein
MYDKHGEINQYAEGSENYRRQEFFNGIVKSQRECETFCNNLNKQQDKIPHEAPPNKHVESATTESTVTPPGQHPGERIDPYSGIVQRKGGFFGNKWVDTNIRVDPRTGEIERKNFFGWKPNGQRVDPQTGRFQEFRTWREGFLSLNKASGWIDL